LADGRHCPAGIVSVAVTGTFRGSSSFVIGSLLTLNSRSGRSMLKKTILWDFLCSKGKSRFCHDDDDDGDEWLRSVGAGTNVSISI
jgi:hypothetical protein